MTKRIRTAKQLANDQRLKDEAAARRGETPVEVQPIQEIEVNVNDMQAMQRQIDQLMESNALLNASMVADREKARVAQYSQQTPTVNNRGSLIGVFEKYVLDPDNYPSPVERIMAEPRLAPLAFSINYHMDYKYTVRNYDTKQGINTSEPEFTIELWRNVLDANGKTTKRYRARRMVFHEDPQAAMVIAHDNNIAIDKEDERNFLNEMRYLRVRDWVFDIFWPKTAQDNQAVKEEVIGNQLVQVIEVSSKESADLTEQLGSANIFKS